MNTHTHTGHGAETQPKPSHCCALTLGAHLSGLAAAFGRSFCRKWEAGRAREVKAASGAVELRWTGGRTLEASDAEEIAAIYHAHSVAAYARSGVVPASKRELYRARGNALPFRALLCWHRAFRSASRQVRSYLWGHGAEACQIESLAVLHDLRQLAQAWGVPLRWEAGNEDASAGTLGAWESIAAGADAESIAAGARRAFFSPVDRARVRRQLRHARWCLRAFWMLGTSRKWRSGFVADNALLIACASAARGYGVSMLQALGLLHETGGAANGALRVRIHALRLRLAAGDLLLTEQPGQVAAAFAAFLGVRRGGTAARQLVGEILPGVAGRAAIADDVRAERALSEVLDAVAREASERVAVVTLPASPKAGRGRRVPSLGAFINARGQVSHCAATVWEIDTAQVRLVALGGNAATVEAAQAAAAYRPAFTPATVESVQGVEVDHSAFYLCTNSRHGSEAWRTVDTTTERARVARLHEWAQAAASSGRQTDTLVANTRELRDAGNRAECATMRLHGCTVADALARGVAIANPKHKACVRSYIEARAMGATFAL